MAQFKKIVTHRPGLRDLKFVGRPLAEASCNADDLNPEKARDSWSARRQWTLIRIYAREDRRATERPEENPGIS